MYQSQTADAKWKGDEGIFAAIDAAGLAQVLRGATLSRLCARERTLPASLDSAAESTAPITSAAAAADALRSNPNGPVLGVPPPAFAPTNASESVRARTRLEILQDPVLGFESQVTVGLPDTTTFSALVPYLTKLRPGTQLTFDELQHMLHILEASAIAPSDGAGRHHGGITTLDLTAAVVPSVTAPLAGAESTTQPHPQEGPMRVSPAALEQLVAELSERYPLPTAKPRGGAGEKGDEEDAEGDADDEAEAGDDDEEDGEASEDRKHNAALRARCEQLQIPYTNYRSALRDVALYEAEVFPCVCRYLETDTQVKVLLLGRNRLGAESQRAEGTVDLRALRALAAMLDANESLRVLDLSRNELGPNGIGIVAKALTKNICLQEIDLSENKLNVEAMEEAEDPTFTEEDPVFGERYAGLEAVGEVLKKNKFLRVLRLASNGIHAGEDLTAPAEADDGGAAADEESGTSGRAGAISVMAPASEDVIAGWAEAPLWKLLEPLQRFHRLAVLDLRGNQLGVLGARMLATALHKNHSVRALDLTDNGIGYRGLHYLADLVLASPTSRLETLILQRNDLTGKSRNPNTQKKLRLKPKKAALDAMAAVARALDGNVTLRRLVLAENHLGPVLSATLLSTISRAHALEELDFSWNEACGDHETVLDLTAAHHLATALYMVPSGAATAAVGAFTHPPRLARLYLGGNNLCAGGLAALFPSGMFAPKHTLCELDLSRNYVGDELGPLARLLRTAPSMDRLDLSYNHVTTAAALLPGLRANASLTVLNLSHNQLGMRPEERHHTRTTAHSAGSTGGDACAQDDVVALWHTVAEHAALCDVDLSGNDLHDGHVRALVEALTPADPATVSAPQLARVDLRNNARITAPAARELLEVLCGRPGMQVVSVSIPKPPGMGAGVGPHTIRSSGDGSSPATTPASTAAEEKLQAQTVLDILQTMARTIEASPTLLDVSCAGGLLRGPAGEALAASPDVESAVEKMRRKLLLNALLADRQA